MLLAKTTTTIDLRRALPAAVNALVELCYPEDSDYWQQCEEISLFSNGLCSCATNATTQRASKGTTKWYCGVSTDTAQDVNERIPSQPQQEE